MKRFLFAAFALSLFSGCYREFEPVKLEVIGSNEEAFLIPLVGDSTKQTSTNNEEFYRKNIVATKQIRIPQQWHPLGYEWIMYNGEWQDAARLIKVSTSPVTLEWTADENSGTSNKNEAIWVMTSDQVEFSTGWTITARIPDRDSAVKFLHNYPSGSLKEVMNTEIRSKLQSVFGLEVTDLPMDQLRKGATPHIKKTVDSVVEFFKERGIAITNLGISGGFVYKDKSIIDTMVKVFNAEQEKSVAKAETEAQIERNKKLKLEAESKAIATVEQRRATIESDLAEKKAKSEGIRLIAEANAFEMEKANKNPEMYLAIKKIEIEKARLEKWDGSYPRFFNGGNPPEMLFNADVFGVSAIEKEFKKSK